MDGTNIHKFPTPGFERKEKESRIDEIRELLLGDQMRTTEAKLAALALRIDELEANVARQLQEVSKSLEAISADTQENRREDLREIAQKIETLADGIRNITKTSPPSV